MSAGICHHWELSTYVVLKLFLAVSCRGSSRQNHVVSEVWFLHVISHGFQSGDAIPYSWESSSAVCASQAVLNQSFQSSFLRINLQPSYILSQHLVPFHVQECMLSSYHMPGPMLGAPGTNLKKKHGLTSWSLWFSWTSKMKERI